MSIDRAELAGTGAALVFHAALIAALSLSLAHVTRPPEPPPMEVELVDEVGLPVAATPTGAPPPPSQAPEQAPQQAQVEAPPLPPQPTPAPSPQIAVAPTPRIAPAPSPTGRPRRTAQARPTPPPAAPTPAPASPSAAAPAKPHASRIGADFLKGLDDPLSPSSATARPSAPAISASAMAGIQQAIRRQVQPCANRQINPGPGASKIKVKLHLVLSRSGGLSRPPEVVSTSGVDDDNARYEERVKDLAVASFTGCAPLAGLPQELYQTANGGWSNFNMTYSLP